MKEQTIFVPAKQPTLPLNQRELADLLQPEDALENAFLEDAEFRRGLQWGVPRYGHPEGAIWCHILEVNANIDRLAISPSTRRLLRIVSWVHDTFKYLEDRSIPRDWSKHHGVLARRFLENYVQDPLLLNLVELHDEAYYIWRLSTAMGEKNQRVVEKTQQLRHCMGGYWQLYYLFYKCDTVTGDKTQAPMKWFEANMKGIALADFLPEKPRF